MRISDEVRTTRRDVLDMVLCRHDYGHANSIMNDWLWSLLGKRLYDAEIGEYATELGNSDGYGEEDVEEATENLTEWRDEMLRLSPPRG